MKRIGLYPRVHADTSGVGVVSQAGGVTLVETVRAAGLDRALSVALAPWRKSMAIHDPGTVITDLAVALALGGNCLAEIALLRAKPAVFGRVASDPTVSRTIDALAADVKRALAAIDTARAAARSTVWRLAGEHAPDHDIDADRPLIIDTDATLITAHSDKEQAAPTFKRGVGFHPLWAFLDHGPAGTGEPLTCLQISCAILALAVELTAWTQMLALPGHDARRWEPKRLRLRLFSIAARLAEHGRTRRLHLSTHAPWAGLLAEMTTRLQTLPTPG